ncbi:MAG TPA: tetratricopeptide repeat protein, partial [Gemmatimonadaceae bacterium]|nr:tetratricopeptide repeat protein [Gemmatimonadaceae bacterium]
PLLLRLLEMKRHKGDDHPEVATVLASLAAVRQTQGHHESAEQLWRRVLDIRERTLAPNHFAVATALERLADTCAARGKNVEALELFQRAYGMRERTLGAGHASLRVSRERIADLQLQASEDFGDMGELETSGLSSAAIMYAAPAPLPPVPAPISMAPQFPMATFKKPEAPLTFNSVSSIPAAAAPVAPPSPYRDLLLSIEKDLEDEDEAASGPNKLSAMAAAAMAMLTERRKAVTVGVGAVVFLLLALAADSRAGTEVGALSADPATTPAPRTDPLSSSALSIPVRNTPKPATESVRATLSNFISSRTKAAEPRAERKSEERSALSKVAIPKVSQDVLAGAESIARSINVPASSVPDAASSQAGSTAARVSLSSVEYTESAGPTRARLIGSLPVPRVPDQVSDAQGEVRVWFRVDTMGKPMMGTFSVAHSPNELLTAAVRRLIPDLRFEPARTGGANPKPAIDSVEIGFKFARK